jgi:hypothetical protein
MYRYILYALQVALRIKIIVNMELFLNADFAFRKRKI